MPPNGLLEYEQVVDQLFCALCNPESPGVTHRVTITRRPFKKAVHQGRSERRGEAYSVPYVEPRSEARTQLADFFNGLLMQRSAPT